MKELKDDEIVENLKRLFGNLQEQSTNEGPWQKLARKVEEDRKKRKKEL